MDFMTAFLRNYRHAFFEIQNLFIKNNKPADIILQKILIYTRNYLLNQLFNDIEPWFEKAFDFSYLDSMLPLFTRSEILSNR